MGIQSIPILGSWMLSRYTTLKVILSLVGCKSSWCWKSQITSGWHWAAFRKLYISGLQRLNFCNQILASTQSHCYVHWRGCAAPPIGSKLLGPSFKKVVPFLTPLHLVILCTSNIKWDHLDTSDVIELNTTYVLTFTKSLQRSVPTASVQKSSFLRWRWLRSNSIDN